MNCPKCRGLMLFERFQFTTEISYSWKCVICGEIIDDVILKNREIKKLEKSTEAVLK